MNNRKPILLVEDDKVDVLTVKRALQEIKVLNALIVKQNGEEALDYLIEKESALPCIIILDLRMPKMGGIEFLEIVKKDSTLKTIPVVVMTTSNEEIDIVSSYQLGVAGYIVKPVDYKRFVEAMRTVDIYWTLNELPV